MLILSSLLVLGGGAGALLDEAAKELQAFHRTEALALLERVKAMAPLDHDEHVRLYEQLGIAYAYLDDEHQAAAAFDMLLALEPGHVLPYTLSPKVTFRFELARRASDARPAPEVRVTWPLGLQVDDAVPLTLEVVGDPRGFLHDAVVYARRRGEETWDALPVPLAPVGDYRRLDLAPRPAQAPGAVQLYVVARDQRGNEVLEFGSAAKPYEIALAYEPPTPWYARWWVWAVGGVIVASATGAAIYYGAREAPRTIPTEVVLLRR